MEIRRISTVASKPSTQIAKPRIRRREGTTALDLDQEQFPTSQAIGADTSGAGNSNPTETTPDMTGAGVTLHTEGRGVATTESYTVSLTSGR